MGVSEPRLKGGATPACGSFCCGVCSFVSLALGVLLILVGIWSTHLYQRFTPVYTEIQCELQPPKFERLWFDSFLVGMHVKLVTTTTCTNPNPYTVVMHSTRAGEVYMGKDKAPSGTLTRIPSAKLPAGGSGSIEAEIVVTPTAETLGSGLNLITGVEVPIYLENNMELRVDIDFLFGNFSTKRAFNKDCGLNMKMVGPAKAAVGPLACADAWDELTIPPVDSENVGTMAFSAKDMASEEVDEATDMKNTSLGVAMGIGYGFGLILLVCGACGVFRFCFRRKAREVAESEACKSTKDVVPQSVINEKAHGRGEEV